MGLYVVPSPAGGNLTGLHAHLTNPAGKAGFPQIYVLDPDRNVVEINAERLD